VQNAVLLLVTICVIVLVAMLFGGWSIRETKQRIKPLENNQEVFKKQSEAEEKVIQQINFKVDSLEKVIEAKNKERAKQVTIIYKNKDEANKKIDTYNSDSIREAFRRL
jgi:Tfp pilus assembly protein PilN